MGSIDPKRANVILGVTREVLPDVWTFVGEQSGLSPTAQRILLERYRDQLGGLAAGLVQQVAAATDLGPGWAPWDRIAVQELFAPDPQLVMSGQILAKMVGQIVDGTTPRELIEVMISTVRELIGVWTDLLTSIPVVGWIVEIVVGLAFAVWDLVEMHRQAREGAAELYAVPSPAPSVDVDASFTATIVAQCQTHDWTSIWLPQGTQFVCPLIRKDSRPFPHGRVITSSGDGGLGVIPGASTVAEQLVMVGLTNPEAASLGWRIIETGDWLTSTQAAAAQAWSLLWGRGPSAFAVDCDAIVGAWRDYLLELVDRLDKGALCGELSAEQRQTFRDFILYRQGLNGDATIPVILNNAHAIVAIRALRERQDRLMASDVVAYVDVNKAPLRLRPRLEEARRSVLGVSALLCHLDLSLIPDPVFRAEAEMRKATLGKGCLFASSVQAPDINPGPTGFGLARVQLPKPPAAAFPRALPPPRVGGSSSSSSPSSADGGGAGLGILAAAVIAGLIFAANK